MSRPFSSPPLRPNPIDAQEMWHGFRAATSLPVQTPARRRPDARAGGTWRPHGCFCSRRRMCARSSSGDAPRNSPWPHAHAGLGLRGYATLSLTQQSPVVLVPARTLGRCVGTESRVRPLHGRAGVLAAGVAVGRGGTPFLPLFCCCTYTHTLTHERGAGVDAERGHRGVALPMRRNAQDLGVRAYAGSNTTGDAGLARPLREVGTWRRCSVGRGPLHGTFRTTLRRAGLGKRCTSGMPLLRAGGDMAGGPTTL
ncbi:hypothetical protein B0H17DRAFT_1115229 [Mycena rosella]|uniref:Uncharacterized protein n=1 Tax=Mycena rosella TaxID=1033263 RepID=A0AAD7FFD4_MYCRO|nr:hypothetical protein B0H17DRAFT_1115229 [Mycena rosella]